LRLGPFARPLPAQRADLQIRLVRFRSRHGARPLIDLATDLL